MPYQQPSKSDVHVDAFLTNLSVAYRQDASAFVASRFAPEIPVTKESNKYPVYTKGYWLRSLMKKRAPSTESAGAGYEVSSDNYLCDEWSLHKDVDDRIRANQDDPIDMDRDANEFLAQQALLNREVEFSNTYFKAGVWTGDYTGVAGSPGASEFKQWNDAASDPVGDIRAGKRRILQRTGKMGNTLVLGREGFDVLIDHPDIVGRFDRGQTAGVAVATEETLAALFGLRQVLVMDGIQNTANEGAADVINFIGGKSALLAYVEPNPGVLKPSAAYTFAYTGMFGAARDGTRMLRMREDKTHSDRFEIQSFYDMKVVAADLGAFFATVIA